MLGSNASVAPTPPSPPAKTAAVSGTTTPPARPRPTCADSPSELVGDLTTGRVPADASAAERQFRAALNGYGDSACRVVAFCDMAPGRVTPGEREFGDALRGILAAHGAHCADWMEIVHDDTMAAPLPPKLRREVRTKIVAVNAFKLLHKMGIKAGPSFVPHTKFPLWRPATWKNRKIVPGIAFVGLGDVARCESAKAVHPFDFVRSTRFNNCVMIREAPDPALHACEDYVAHHMHGLRSIARMLTLSFIDVDSAARTFRVYQVQGCSRLYGWDELADPRVARALAAKVFVKGRIPRSRDFALTQRAAWAPDVAPLVARAQAAMTAAMPALDPLLAINLTPAQLLPYCVLDIAPAVVAAFLDGRSGMSYGFLAFVMPTGPVETASRVSILCTRSGCNKKAPHKDRDWVILSCEADAFALETSAALKGVTSPSFDSWLILAQAAANVSLAKRLKAAGKAAAYVQAVEAEGLALAHYHGFVDRAALPPTMAYFGQDKPPLPCGSVDAALITLEEKAAIGDRVLAVDGDVVYDGDVHIEPDHGVVVSTRFDTLATLLPRSQFGLAYYETYKTGPPGRGERPFHYWEPTEAAAPKQCCGGGCGGGH